MTSGYAVPLRKAIRLCDVLRLHLFAFLSFSSALLSSISAPCLAFLSHPFPSPPRTPLVHGVLGSSRSSLSSLAEDYFMWQRLACDDDKACLVQLEWGFSAARWKYLGTYRLILPNNTVDDADTKKNIQARTSPG